MDGEVARLGFRRFGLRFEKRETTGFSRVADRIKVFLRLSRYEQARKIRNRAKLRVKVSCIQHSFPISSLVVSQFFQLTERKISTSRQHLEQPTIYQNFVISWIEKRKREKGETIRLRYANSQ